MKTINDIKTKFESKGIILEDVFDKINNIPLSVHCWQGDDVNGFENADNLDGGISVSGDFPGRASTLEELQNDFLKSMNYVPGKKKISLHAIYGIGIEQRDHLSMENFQEWVNFAKENSFGIDFNPTMFSHKNAKNFTLSSPDPEIKNFWIKHCNESRKIAHLIANELNDEVLCNIWIPDGFKDYPADRVFLRKNLKDSLDKIFATKYENVIDCVESKTFGVGLEGYTVGSSDFYQYYTNENKDVLNLIDIGHYNELENIADKISSIMMFNNKIALHLTRPMHWDSDHVLCFDDKLRTIMETIASDDSWDNIYFGLDYFDASINRVAAWILGARNARKAMLSSLLFPWEEIKMAERNGDYTKRLVMLEENRMKHFTEIWNEYCKYSGVSVDEKWLADVEQYLNVIVKERNNG